MKKSMLDKDDKEKNDFLMLSIKGNKEILISERKMQSLEERPKGIRANLIHSGLVETDRGIKHGGRMYEHVHRRRVVYGIFSEACLCIAPLPGEGSSYQSTMR